jgi:hypothetical protein
MARISQTVSQEAYEIYNRFVDKRAGLTAALLAFEYLDVPNDVFRALIEGSFENIHRNRAEKSATPTVESKNEPSRSHQTVPRQHVTRTGVSKESVDTIVQPVPGITTSVEMINDDENLVSFDPFEPF